MRKVPDRQRRRTAAASIAALAVPLLGSSVASAGPFTTVDCPRYPAWQEIPVGYSTGEMHQDYNRPGHANNLVHDRTIHANARVSHMYFKFAPGGNLEFNYDFFHAAPQFTVDPADWQSYTGTLSTSWHHVSLPFRAQAQALWTRLTTDGSVAAAGFALDKVGVSCEPNLATGHGLLNPGVRSMGVLLGADDSVTFYFPAASGSGGARSTNFILWSDTPGADVDLYVRCNAVATKEIYTWRGYSSDAQEFIHAAAADCAPGGVWYVTVHNFLSTPSQFNLVASYNLEALAMDVGVRVSDYHPGFTELEAIAYTSQAVVQGTRRLYGSTEGGLFLRRIDTCSESTYSTYCSQAGVQVERRYDCERSYAWGWPILKQIVLCNDATGVTASHEFGHAVLGLGDEYRDVGNPPASLATCGHSLMGNYPWWLNNLCYSGNHNKDWQSGSGGPSSLPNAWSVVTGGDGWWPRAPPEMVPFKTPDNVSFVSHDFNGAVPVFIHY